MIEKYLNNENFLATVMTNNECKLVVCTNAEKMKSDLVKMKLYEPTFNFEQSVKNGLSLYEPLT